MLEIINLSSGYNSENIVNDINLIVSAGEIISILGPNGAGKTTLIRTISGIIGSYSGRIYFKNRDIKEYKRKDLAREIAVVSQSMETEDMTVEEYVLLGRIPYYGTFQFFETRNDEIIINKYMELTGIIEHRNQPLNKISGGERQLAHIGRALVQEPKLLLLDEPTAYLDIMHQVKILDLIKRLNRELGITVIMALHDLNLASEYSDRIVLLNNGFVYKEGRPQEVLTYKSIEDVYKTLVIVKENSVSKKPYVLVVPEEQKSIG